MLQREQDAPGGGPRQFCDLGDFAQAHRRGALTEDLQQSQAAIEAFDKVGGTDLAVLAFQLRHGLAHLGMDNVSLAVPMARATILNKCSIDEQANWKCFPSQARYNSQRPRTQEVTRHDEPGTERPDHPHRPEGPLRQADAELLAAGGAARRTRRPAAGAPG